MGRLGRAGRDGGMKSLVLETEESSKVELADVGPAVLSTASSITAGRRCNAFRPDTVKFSYLVYFVRRWVAAGIFELGAEPGLTRNAPGQFRGCSFLGEGLYAVLKQDEMSVRGSGRQDAAQGQNALTEKVSNVQRHR